MCLCRRVHRFLSCASCFVALLAPATMLHAQCSKSKVMNLSEEGETVADIAEECEMSKREVRKILERDVERDSTRKKEARLTNEPQQGLPAGTPLAPCACWGPADPRIRQPAPQCASGYAQPQICNTVCQMGGLAWYGVCL
jgi:hypothetical protein